ncbi:MAG: hypothetical protein ABFS37_15310 [Acidobacteriota bacterium]
MALVWLVAGSVAAASFGTPGGTSRPEIVVADEACACPSAAGTFVVLFDPERGVLLLSGAPFPGGHEVGEATGAAFDVPGARPWTLDRAGGGAGPARLWAARYTTRLGKDRGCVGFDKQQFSAEGDLFTYARWLIEKIYLELPAEERRRWPGFRLSDRQVELRVEREGFGPIRLQGKEGATLACRFPDSERLLLFMPFVLDAATGRVAVKVGYSDRPYWEKGEKPSLGFVVTAPTAPATLAEPPLVITVEGVGAPDQQSSP